MQFSMLSSRVDPPVSDRRHNHTGGVPGGTSATLLDQSTHRYEAAVAELVPHGVGGGSTLARHAHVADTCNHMHRVIRSYVYIVFYIYIYIEREIGHTSASRS